MDADQCFICFGKDNIISSNICCGVTYYHQSCFNEFCAKSGTYCPICRNSVLNKLEKKAHIVFNKEKYKTVLSNFIFFTKITFGVIICAYAIKCMYDMYQSFVTEEFNINLEQLYMNLAQSINDEKLKVSLKLEQLYANLDQSINNEKLKIGTCNGEDSWNIKNGVDIQKMHYESLNIQEMHNKQMYDDVKILQLNYAKNSEGIFHTIKCICFMIISCCIINNKIYMYKNKHFENVMQCSLFVITYFPLLIIIWFHNMDKITHTVGDFKMNKKIFSLVVDIISYHCLALNILKIVLEHLYICSKNMYAYISSCIYKETHISIIDYKVIK